MDLLNSIMDGCNIIKNSANSTRRSLNKFVDDVVATKYDNERMRGTKRDHGEVEPEPQEVAQTEPRKRTKKIPRSQLAAHNTKTTKKAGKANIAKVHTRLTTTVEPALRKEQNTSKADAARTWIEKHTPTLTGVTQERESKDAVQEVSVNFATVSTPTQPLLQDYSLPKQTEPLFPVPHVSFSERLKTAEQTITQNDGNQYKQLLAECDRHPKQQKKRIAALAKASGKCEKDVYSMLTSTEILSDHKCSSTPDAIETHVAALQHTATPPFSITEERPASKGSSPSVAKMMTEVMNTFTASQAQMMSTFAETQKKIMESIDKKIEVTDAKIEATNVQIKTLQESVASSAMIPANMATEIKKAVIDVLVQLAPHVQVPQQDYGALPPQNEPMNYQDGLVSGLGVPLSQDELMTLVSAYNSAQQQFGESVANQLLRNDLIRLAQKGYDVFNLFKLMESPSSAASDAPTLSPQQGCVVEAMDTSPNPVSSPEEAKHLQAERALLFAQQRREEEDQKQEEGRLVMKLEQTQDQLRYLKDQLRIQNEPKTHPKSPQMGASNRISGHQAISQGTTGEELFDEPVDTPQCRVKDWSTWQSRVVCKYVQSAAGCRKGDNCPFYHPHTDGPIPENGDNAAPAGTQGAIEHGPAPAPAADTESYLSPELCSTMNEQLALNPEDPDVPIITPDGLSYYDGFLTRLLMGLLASRPALDEEQLAFAELIRRADCLILAIQASKAEHLAACGISKEAYQQHAQSVKVWAESLGRRNLVNKKFPQWIFQSQMRLQKIAVKIGQALNPRAVPGRHQNNKAQSSFARQPEQTVYSENNTQHLPKVNQGSGFRGALPLAQIRTGPRGIRVRGRGQLHDSNDPLQAFSQRLSTGTRQQGGRGGKQQQRGMFNGLRNPATAQLEQAQQVNSGINIRQNQLLLDQDYNDDSFGDMEMGGGNQQGRNRNKRLGRNNRNRNNHQNRRNDKNFAFDGPPFPGNDDAAIADLPPPSPSQEIKDWEAQQNWLPGEKEVTDVLL